MTLEEFERWEKQGSYGPYAKALLRPFSAADWDIEEI